MLNSSNYCPFCNNIYANNNKPLLLPCGHSFCQECLKYSSMKNEKQCFICKASWASTKIKFLVFCLQLIPNEIDLSGNKESSEQKIIKSQTTAKTGENENENISQKDLCPLHGYEIDFWCNFDGQMLCKSCLLKNHKNCDWVLLENYLNNLEIECDHSKAQFSDKLNQVQNAFLQNSLKLANIRKLMNYFQHLEERVEHHQRMMVAL